MYKENKKGSSINRVSKYIQKLNKVHTFELKMWETSK